MAGSSRNRTRNLRSRGKRSEEKACQKWSPPAGTSTACSLQAGGPQADAQVPHARRSHMPRPVPPAVAPLGRPRPALPVCSADQRECLSSDTDGTWSPRSLGNAIPGSVPLRCREGLKDEGVSLKTYYLAQCQLFFFLIRQQKVIASRFWSLQIWRRGAGGVAPLCRP